MMYREIISVAQVDTKHINTAVWTERKIVVCLTGGTVKTLILGGYI